MDSHKLCKIILLTVSGLWALLSWGKHTCHTQSKHFADKESFVRGIFAYICSIKATPHSGNLLMKIAAKEVF